MKLLFAVAVAAVIAAPLSAQRATSTRGYVKRDGTYVAPSMRTAPDSSRYNNWSSKPNVNPYTGKAGTVDPYAYKPYKPKY